jgi:hypothetical protein
MVDTGKHHDHDAVVDVADVANFQPIPSHCSALACFFWPRRLLTVDESNVRRRRGSRSLLHDQQTTIVDAFQLALKRICHPCNSNKFHREPHERLFSAPSQHR